MYKLIIFAVATLGLTIFSWPSLRNPRSHGFFRFFAWEAILGMILLNLGVWFRDPFSIPQIVSWVLLVISLFLVIHGVYLLKAVGKPRDALEDTTKLVLQGAYRYIRHPLYSSLFFLAWGVFFKNPDFLNSTLVIIATLFLVATARVEEAENLQKFGAEYADYMKKSKMFIPFVL